MSIVKPYTFVAGNKARANEVNEDFDILYQQVNTNITNIANVEGDIQTLSSTKANVNGDSTQRFAVADPVSSGDAINKRTLFKQIGNSIDYIGGLTISKDSGSPNDTILIDPGACYDSTKEVVLALDVLTTKQNSPQSANTAYYVYIIGSDTGSSIDILISTEPSVPALPTGYTRYRKIGSYTTDGNGNIDTIYSFGNNTSQANPQATIIKTYINGNSGYRIWSDGYCVQWGNIHSNRGYDATQVYFLKTFANTNYQVYGTNLSDRGNWEFTVTTKNTSDFYFKFYVENPSDYMWEAKGYLASGQY